MQLRRYLLSASVNSKQPQGEARYQNRFAKLLPYLCDRRVQQRRFATVVQEQMEQRSGKPLFFFVVGQDSQCADKFVEQLYLLNLPRILQANGLSGRVEDKLLRWPAEFSSRASGQELADKISDLEFELKERLGLKLTPGASLIQKRLDQQTGALFLYFDVNLNRWNRAQAALLKSWISWWSGIKLAERRYPVIIVGRFCYLPAGVWPFGIASRSVRMLRELSRLHRDVGEDVSLTILPQLGNITLEDVNEW